MLTEGRCKAMEGPEEMCNRGEDVRGVLRYANGVIAVERPCVCHWGMRW